MTIPRFGRTVPIHGAILNLIGWRLSRTGSHLIEDRADRLEKMRSGRVRLVEATGQDFGYDLGRWREYLLEHDEHGYRHPYAFSRVDEEVRSALGDPLFLLRAQEALALDRQAQ